MPRVDLHSHSTFSDGSLDPERLAGYLASRGAAYAALTDHDTTEGSERFREALARRGVGCVDGVELTTRCSLGEAHILAYSAGPHHPLLTGSLPRAREGRNAPGLAGRPVGTGRLGRSGLGLPSTVDAVRALRATGATAFLAHPLQLTRDEAALERLLDELVPAGLDGIEAIYGAYGSAERETLLALAARRGLAVCAGSDFHEPGAAGPAGVEDMDEDLWRGFRETLLRRAAPVGRSPSCGRGARYARRPHLARIALPAFAAVLLFVAALFAFVLPQVRSMLLEHKKETIREIAESAVSILAEYEKEIRAGSIGAGPARADAAARLRDIRYGPEGKDYLWITDTLPRMVMHPYRPELNGQDLREFKDDAGFLVFVEFVRAASAAGGGYVEYLWQWKDDARRVVPKLSYVLRFEPWDWIVGTGVYLEDVNAEIASLTSRLVLVSAAVSALLALILGWMVRQGLKAERARLRAEEAVRESRERYRALVEASNEGMVIVKDGACSFPNASILEMTGFTEHELLLLATRELFVPYSDGGEAETAFLDSLAAGETPAEPPSRPFACMLSRKSGAPLEVMVSASRFALGGSEGMILAARGAEAAPVEPPRGSETEGAGGAGVGLAGAFVARWSRRAGLVQADGAALAIFGASGAEELRRLGLFSLFPERGEELFGLLSAHHVAARFRARMAPPGASSREVLVTAFVDGSSGTEGPRVLGIVEDIGAESRAERAAVEGAALLGSEGLGIMASAASFASPPLFCGPDAPLSEAAESMRRSGASEILVRDAGGRALGALSEGDLSRLVVAGGMGSAEPAYRAMSSPLVLLPEDASAAEAREAMLRSGLPYAALSRPDGSVSGIIRMESLAATVSPFTAIADGARRARSIAELADLRSTLVEWARTVIAAGARARTIARLFSDCHDIFVRRLVELASSSLGDPPCGFAFVALGSAGRGELIPGSDQDNAIVYSYGRSDGAAQRPYFQALGERVCGALVDMGLPLCSRGLTAANPECCAPVGSWESYFARRIREPEPENVLEINAFFDMRTMAGDEGITLSLREAVFGALRAEPPFLIHLANAARSLKIPASPIAGLTAAKEAAALFPAFARAYALKAGIRETGTADRLERLTETGALGLDTARASIEAFEYLLRRRLETALARPSSPGISPEGRRPVSGRLGESQERAALAQAAVLQKRIGFDFLGSAT